MLIRQAARKNDLPRIQGPDVGMEVRHVSLMRSDCGKSAIIYTERRSEVLTSQYEQS